MGGGKLTKALLWTDPATAPILASKLAEASLQTNSKTSESTSDIIAQIHQMLGQMASPEAPVYHPTKYCINHPTMQLCVLRKKRFDEKYHPSDTVDSNLKKIESECNAIQKTEYCKAHPEMSLCTERINKCIKQALKMQSSPAPVDTKAKTVEANLKEAETHCNSLQKTKYCQHHPEMTLCTGRINKCIKETLKKMQGQGSLNDTGGATIQSTHADINSVLDDALAEV